MGKGDREVKVASVWRHELLGSVALYEVVEDLGEIVLVVVREAPGLAAGTQLRMTRAALDEMVPVTAPSRRAPRP
jgi:hypothetical protein